VEHNETKARYASEMKFLGCHSISHCCPFLEISYPKTEGVILHNTARAGVTAGAGAWARARARARARVRIAGR